MRKRSVAPSTVSMPMMQIRIMRVLVANGLVPMPVGMWLRYWDIMMVLMMFVVNVAVLMLKDIVLMLMLVPLGEVQPKPAAHQHSRQ
jgi:hypothetical protein